jgi:hypothetical protein
MRAASLQFSEHLEKTQVLQSLSILQDYMAKYPSASMFPLFCSFGQRPWWFNAFNVQHPFLDHLRGLFFKDRRIFELSQDRDSMRAASLQFSEHLEKTQVLQSLSILDKDPGGLTPSMSNIHFWTISGACFSKTEGYFAI